MPICAQLTSLLSAPSQNLWSCPSPCCTHASSTRAFPETALPKCRPSMKFSSLVSLWAPAASDSLAASKTDRWLLQEPVPLASPGGFGLSQPPCILELRGSGSRREKSVGQGHLEEDREVCIDPVCASRFPGTLTTHLACFLHTCSLPYAVGFACTCLSTS